MNDMISVVVPIYNGGKYIERSIQSILEQTYTNIEVIAVDDGSTDNSLEILNYMREADARIRLVCQENKGVTSARIAGVKAAKGDWIGFVDVDDEIETTMYNRLLINAKDYYADISHCGYQMIFPSRVDYYYDTGKLLLQDNQRGLKDLIEGKFIEPGLCNKLYRRKLFNKLLIDNYIDTSIKNTEDLLMNFYLFREANTSVYEDFCPYHYIKRAGSASTAKINENKLGDPLKVLKIIRNETLNNRNLQEKINSRIAGRLIQLATKNDADRQSGLIQRYKSNARRELMEMTPMLLKGNYPMRIKILSTWAAFSPITYSVVHLVYSKAKGTDKKYEIW